MPENIINVGNKGFELLNKVADKTSPKHKTFNLVPLSIGILGMFLALILINAFTDKIDDKAYNTLIIVSIAILAIYAASNFFEAYLKMKKQQTINAAYNQQYENRS